MPTLSAGVPDIPSETEDNLAVDAELLQRREQLATMMTKAIIVGIIVSAIALSLPLINVQDYSRLIILNSFLLLSAVGFSLYPFLQKRGRSGLGFWVFIIGLLIPTFIAPLLVPTILLGTGQTYVLILLMAYFLLGVSAARWMLGACALCGLIDVILIYTVVPQWFRPLGFMPNILAATIAGAISILIVGLIIRAAVLDQNTNFRRARLANWDVERRIIVEHEQRDRLEKAHREIIEAEQAANRQLKEHVANIEELSAIRERNHLARDLHDSVTQTIFSMTLVTRSALILQERGPEQVAGKLNQLQELSQGALNEMRALIYQLRSVSIAEDGFYAALTNHLTALNRPDNLRIEITSREVEVPLGENQQQELFRIVQEAINNIVKHSEADYASIQISVIEQQVSVVIRDNGVGFDPFLLKHDRTHIGLHSMSERVKELNGTLKFNSTPGNGTEISVTVPVGIRKTSEGRDQ